MKKKAFVLFSGGLDSTVALALAIKDFGRNVEAISIDYGQRHIKETVRAKEICDHYGIHHTILPMRMLLEGDAVSLTNKDADIPDVGYDEIEGISPVYVPFRNGLMLSAVVAHAQKYVLEEFNHEVARQVNDGFSETSAKIMTTALTKDLTTVFAGVHAEDAQSWAYPDCSFEFIGAMANAIYIGTYYSVRLVAPFVNSSKTDIVRIGHELKAPLDLSWSCYKGGEYHCGVCPTCRSRRDAFIGAGLYDPTHYQTDITFADPSSEEFPF